MHFMPMVDTKIAISPSRMPITIKARVACKVPERKHLGHVKILLGAVGDEMYLRVLWRERRDTSTVAIRTVARKTSTVWRMARTSVIHLKTN